MTRTVLKKLEHLSLARPEYGSWPQPTVPANLRGYSEMVLKAGTEKDIARLINALHTLAQKENADRNMV